MYDATEVPRCNIAKVEPRAEWTSLTPQNLWVRLPQGWQVAGEAVQLFDTATIVRGPGESSISITYLPTGAVGASYLGTGPGQGPASAGVCEFAHDSTGSIWTIYGANAGVRSPDSVERYTAYGDVLTSSSVRYQIRLHTRSARARDSLVRLIADHAAQQ